MLKVRCKVCQKRVAVPVVYIGRQVKCPACKEPILVTADGLTPPDPTPSPAPTARQPPTPAAAVVTDAAIPVALPLAALTPPDVAGVLPRTPVPALSPGELLRLHPKVAAAVAVASACALVSIVRAMLDTNSHDGGSSLWHLLAAAMYVWVAVQGFRRSDQVRNVGMTLAALAAAVVVIRLLEGGGSPLDVLNLVLSAGLFTLLFSSKESFPARRVGASVVVGRLRSGIVAGMANIAASRDNAHIARPIAIKPSPARLPDQPSAKLAYGFQSFNGVLGWTIACLSLLVLSNYQSLAKLWTHLFIGDWFGIFVGIEILIGGIGAAGWLWTNRAAVRSPNGPARRSGRIGAYGMVLLMVVAGSTTVGALTEDYLIPPPHHVVADGPTFLEFDGKYGATALDHGRSIDRSHMTSAQAQSELNAYLGRTVRWQGTVVDVKGNLVMIQVIPTTAELVVNGNMNAAADRQIAHDNGSLGQDEVQVMLKLAPDSATAATRLSKGQQIDYTGILSAIGSPYPYEIHEGHLN